MSYYPPKHRIWHLRGASANVTGYKRLVMLPQTVETEGTVTGASSGSTEVLIDEWISDVVGVTTLPAGVWQARLKAKVDSASDTTTIKCYVMARDADGNETDLFNMTSAEINDTSAALVVINSASQTAFTVDVTDRVVIKLYAVSNSGSAKTVTVYYQGASNYSTFALPDDIPVREGDMTKDVYDPYGASILTANAVQFATDYAHGSPAIGQLDWNSTDATLDIHLLNSATLQVGQELHFYGKASADIDNGELVMYDGAQGDHIKIKPATSAILTNPEYIIGVATQNITSGDFGYTTWFGKVNGVYTTGWATGDALYIDNSTGQLTNTPGAVIIAMGFVVKAATGASENGIIAINPGFIIQTNTAASAPREILQDDNGAILTDETSSILYVEV